jgi:hypothetical protein
MDFNERDTNALLPEPPAECNFPFSITNDLNPPFASGLTYVVSQ